MHVFKKIFYGVASNSLIIITYHSIKPEHISRFALQMDQILRSGIPVFSDFCINGRNDHFIAVTVDDGFQSVVRHILPIIVERKIPITVFVPTDSMGRSPSWITDQSHDYAKEKVMTGDQLRSLPPEYVKIGSHCVTHPRLTSLDSSCILYEFKESKRKLEALTGRQITELSFPYNDYNDQIVSMARASGYSRVYANTPLPVSRSSDFLCGRISVSPDDWDIEFQLKILGAYQWLSRAIEMKKMFREFIRKGKITNA